MEEKQKRFPGQILDCAKRLGYVIPPEAQRTRQPSFYVTDQKVETGFEAVSEVLALQEASTEKEKLRELYGWFRECFQTMENLVFSPTDQDIYFVDWVSNCRKMGFRIKDYFDYELYLKGQKLRSSFISYRYRRRIIQMCICTEDREKYLDDKAVFLETFREFTGRDWLDVGRCTFQEMKRFCRKHPRFFAKKRDGQGGEGAVCYPKEKHPSEELYLELKEKGMILEEYVCQHREVAAFNPETLNTIRVLTLLDAGGDVQVMLAAGRFGRSGGCVDNFHGGGIVVEVDPETGRIISRGIDSAHRKYSVHPDSGKEFKGFVYPYWDKVRATVCKAAAKVPTLRHIGWDVAITNRGKVILIEGNGRPDMNMMQMAGQRGKLKIYKDLIGEIEQLDKGGQHG